jgi:transposase
MPLAVWLTPANRRDEQLLATLLWLAWAALGGRRPGALYGDRGYGFPWAIALVLAWRIRSRLAVRGSAHGSGLGRVRYVVERTFSWLGRFRRLAQCYERSGAHFRGFHVLACCVVCANRLRRAGPRRPGLPEALPRPRAA